MPTQYAPRRRGTLCTSSCGVCSPKVSLHGKAHACLMTHPFLQAELEDKILFLLSTATGSLLDNVTLINTLDASKTTWETVNKSLQASLPAL